MRSKRTKLAPIVAAFLTGLCGSCFPINASYDLLFTPLDATTNSPLNAAHVRVALLRDGQSLSVYDADGMAWPLGGDAMTAWIVVDIPEVRCILGLICRTPVPEFGEPPEEARITVTDGSRTGSVVVPILPEQVVIEDEFYHGQMTLGTVLVPFND